jgi:hypothetical protein
MTTKHQSFNRDRHETFVETRSMTVMRGFDQVPCVVHLEIDVGVIISWMAGRALANKSHATKYLNNAIRCTVRPEDEQ